MAKKDKNGVDTTDEALKEPVQENVDPAPAEKIVDTTDEAAKSSDAQAVASPKNEIDEAKDAIIDAISDVDKVIVIVPKAFKLMYVKGIIRDIPAGVQTVERGIAEHFYAKANGMKIFNPEA